MPETDHLYIIDSSSLIEIKRRYPKDMLPGIWADLHTLVQRDQLIAPIEVMREIFQRDDELTEWAREHDKMFKEIDDDVWESAKSVVAEFPQIADYNSAKSVHADPFVIGLAMVLTNPSQSRLSRREIFVVTDEKSDLFKNPKLPSSQIKRIPDVCGMFKLNCISHLELFKIERFRFH
jgi:hypothetical protein